MESIPTDQAIAYLKDTLFVIGGKWKMPILAVIYDGTSRFRDIQRSVPLITTRVLSKELKDLEENKLIIRTVFTGSPVIVDYKITDYATSLIPILEQMILWGKNHRKKIVEN